MEHKKLIKHHTELIKDQNQNKWEVVQTSDLEEICKAYLEDYLKHNVSKSSGVVRTERGWAGHFICADRCRFRRNTLLAYNDIKIVVSSVGLMKRDDKFDEVGAGRYFETMAFHANKDDKRYFDANVSKQVYFESDWAIAEIDADDKANEMHEAVVGEIITKLEKGYKFIE